MLATGLVWGRTALLWFLTIAVAVFSWRFMVGGVEATMGFVAYHAQLWPIAFFAHVVFAPVALALVPFQLWLGLRNRRPRIHRVLGRPDACVIPAVTALGILRRVLGDRQGRSLLDPSEAA